MTEPIDNSAEIAKSCLKLAEEFIAFIAEKLDLKLTYDAASIEWLDGYLERNRHVFAKMESIENSVNLYGAFLGECLRRNYQGTWKEFRGDWGVVLGSSVAFPFTKVEKQMRGDATDSIAGFYKVMGEIVSGKLNLHDDEARKPEQ